MDLEGARQCPVFPCDNTDLMVDSMKNNQQVLINHICSSGAEIQSKVPKNTSILLIDAYLKNKLDSIKYYNIQHLGNH